MMKIIYIVFFLLYLSFSVYAQQAEIIKYKDLSEIINQKNDTTYVINFWATWCKPCIEELPHFTEAESELTNRKFKFIYISLDFKKDISKLNKWLQNKKMNSTVFLLDEPDYNSWIEKVDKNWEGNIPSTLIYNFSNNYQEFFPTEFSRETLRKTLDIR